MAMDSEFLERQILHVFGPLIGDIYTFYINSKDFAIYGLSALLNKKEVIRYRSEERSKKYAVISSFGKSVPKSIQNLIQILHARDVSILFVNNGTLNTDAFESIKPLVWTVLERPNLGRDFGAYKAGMLFLLKNNIIAERLLVANDSMFYDRIRAVATIDKLLDSKSAFVAATENHSPAYHIGSFLFCVGETVQKSRIWKKYWTTYVPSSSRAHAIGKGEIGMSLALIFKGGFRPEILYSTNALGSKLRSIDLVTLSDLLLIMPKEFRKDIYDSQISEVFKDGLANISLSASFTPPTDRNKAQAFLPNMQSQEQNITRTIYLRSLIDQLLLKMETRSQIHWAGALFIKYFDLGIVKKDFAFRGVYDLNQFVEAMSILSYPDMDEIFVEVEKRGSPASLKGIRLVLYNQGLI